MNCVNLQEYEQQEQQASEGLAKQQKQFETAVAEILGIPAEQQSSQFAEAVQQQQLLQEVQVEQLAVVQQLADTTFAVTDPAKHQAKKARLDRINQVWNWLQDSNGVGNGDAPAPHDSNTAPNGDIPQIAQQHEQHPQQSGGDDQSKQQQTRKQQTQYTAERAAEGNPEAGVQRQEAATVGGGVDDTAEAVVVEGAQSHTLDENRTPADTPAAVPKSADRVDSLEKEN